MNDSQILERLSSTDAYAPETDMPLSAWSRDIAFSEIERRIGVDGHTAVAIPLAFQRTGQRGWIVAAAAFAVVMIVIGAAMLFAQPADDLPPATTPPTTQTVTPTTQATPPTTQPAAPTTVAAAAETPVVDPGTLAWLDAYITELNAGDIDAVATRFEESAVPNFDSSREVAIASHGIAMESTWEYGDCKPLTGGLAWCLIRRTSEYAPEFPASKEFALRVRVEAGELQFYDPDFRAREHHLPAENEFAAWMWENHVDVWILMYAKVADAPGNYFPLYSKLSDAAALKKQYVPLWRSTLDE